MDLSKNETKGVRATTAVVKTALKATGVSPLPQIKPCPDHRLQGSIVQVADMLAGALSQAGDLSGSRAASLGTKITLV